jgi:hypothetical protein
LRKEQTANSTVWLYACSVVYIEREREKESERYGCSAMLRQVDAKMTTKSGKTSELDRNMESRVGSKLRPRVAKMVPRYPA